VQWFSNLATRTKLFLGFGLMLVLLAVVITTAYVGITTIQKSQKVLFEEDFTTALDLSELRSDLNRQRSQMLSMMLTRDKVVQRKLEQDIRGRVEVINKIFERLQKLGSQSPDFIAKIQHIRTILEEYRQTREKQIALIRVGQIDMARRLSLGAQEKRFETIRDSTKKLGEAARARATKATQDSEAIAEQSVRVLIIAGVIAVLVGIIMVTLLNRIIAEPLREISGAAAKIAAGDLTIKVLANHRHDEVGALTNTFSHMLEGLQETNREIAQGVNVLSSSTAQISASTSELAASATETATAVTETTTTVEEIRQTAQVASDKARHVAESAQRVMQISQSGRSATTETAQGMQRIREQMDSIAESMVRLSEQSTAIGEIIATVDDLSRQSNLLAVNAAIEAAKAGEQGKGFSVVAQEVKSLADQSKQATMQVRTILNDIQKATGAAVMATEQGSKAVEVGVLQSAQAGESIVSLADSVTDAAQAATQIAASSQQQLVGMDQVVQAMESIKQASLQNVEGAQQLETAARNLTELGQRLKQQVERYKV
jgi:methyl-accepting chemotaxis protein